jgi:hypothetical protein
VSLYFRTQMQPPLFTPQLPSGPQYACHP